MHRTTGRWKLGFLLALCTALLWGMGLQPVFTR